MLTTDVTQTFPDTWEINSKRVGNFAQIRALDVANGPGIRVSIFVTGCTHACPGCFNSSYQNFQAGQPWTTANTKQLAEFLSQPFIQGLTLLGGEPMQNLWITDLLRLLRSKNVLGLRVKKDVWVYSGYTFSQIISHRGRCELAKQCDVLVDGLFRQEILDLRLRFRGSSNQRILDIPASLASKQPVDYIL